MKYLISLFLLAIPTICLADTICIEKSTGKLIEYQSTNCIETVKNNAISQGYKEESIDVKLITNDEWQKIRQEKIEKPAQEEKTKKILKQIEQENKLKSKLNLTQEDLEALKNALRN